MLIVIFLQFDHNELITLFIYKLTKTKPNKAKKKGKDNANIFYTFNKIIYFFYLKAD